MKLKMKFMTGLVLISLILGCGSNRFDVDVSTIDVKLDIKRLDKDLLENYPDTPDVIKLSEKYGEFLDLYGMHIIQAGNMAQRDFPALLLDFNKYCKEFQVPEKVQEVFGDFSDSEKEINMAFKYVKFYYPNASIPQIYTYLSNFSMSVVTDENILGIGLDKYLGSNCDLYRKLGIDYYKILKMNKEMMVVDCMRAYAISEFPFNDSVNDLVSKMVYEGKIQYFLDAVLPFKNDTLKHGYSQQQYDWANYNEDKMWAYLIENQLLFSTDELTIRKLISDGPFTSLFANNSAPRAGAFLGWKIVHAYMDENKEISLQELMKNNDYQGILNSAAYKP